VPDNNLPEFREDTLYLAGERVAPGLYRQIDGSRELPFEQEGYLPASLDGRVACYTRIRQPGEQEAPRFRARHL
jgi:hypothetical protein